MLIQCPECESQISDKAIACPHCGYPMQSVGAITTPRKRKNKRQRLPNGFGTITELKDPNLRNRFRVMVYVGKDANGRPIHKCLKPQAMFPSYNDAFLALAEYNRNPFDLDMDMTIKELYEKWTEEHFKGLAPQSQTTIKTAWVYCSSIYDMRVKEVRARHLRGCIDTAESIETQGKNKGQAKPASAHMKTRMKSLFNQMFDYAVEYEITDKNYARSFALSDEVRIEMKKNHKKHIPFSDEEFKTLWDNVNKIPYVDWILIQCYMGWRPEEFAELELQNVDLEKWTITGGLKTEAGRQRIVPIHSKIRAFVENNYNFAVSVGSKRLFNARGHDNSPWSLTYNKYANRFKKIVNELDLNPTHTPHDPRVTFVTRGKKAKMNEYAIKILVGHEIKDITEAAYTSRDIEWLREDIEKLN